ncbi:MAG TPA: DedA family protein [Candidatus Acidoferrales bacterium]|jgi:membrane protein DedA with SNARE-associated domain|nr:DedA family protein [Candidatus Acidoferrales bacterium]
MLKKLLSPLLAWYLTALKSLGYPAILLLMLGESSFLPIPCEAIIPPAAYWAHTNQLPLNCAGIIAVAVLGSWLGATIMYWLARKAGRPLVLRYGRFVLFPPDKLEKAERWMSHYGAMGVLVARLLPGARQLVGIPAGIARLNYLQFTIFTIIGATIWCSVLCYVGVKAGQDSDLLAGKLREVTIWLGGGALVLGGLYYFFVHRHLQKKPETDRRSSAA